jgi:hypothetical protein
MSNFVEPHRDYLLAELRCALARAKLAALDIECIGIAVKNNIVSPEQAVALRMDADCFGFIGPQSEERQ